jgi:hypothetical protein
MTQETIITAPQAEAARSGETVTTTTTAWTTVVAGQLFHCQTNKRTAAARQAETP